MAQTCPTWILLIFIGHVVIIQGMCDNINTNGLTFVFSIPTTIDYDGGDPRVSITTPLHNPVQVTLIIPGIEFETTSIVTRYQFANILLPSVARLNQGDGKQNKTVIIKSSDTIAVHVIDREAYDGDGFLALSSLQLGTRYYAASYVPCNIGSGTGTSFLSLSALDHGDGETRVDITTRGGQHHDVVLEAYESFRFDGDGVEDLTGTLVISNKPVSVVSGAFTCVPTNLAFKDGLLEQVPPVRSWGRNFILSPFLERTSGYIYRVLSSNIATSLSISDLGTIQLEANGIYEGDVLNSLISIVSDQPVMVVQYMKAFRSDDRGDPSMVLVTPLETFTNNITFPVFSYFSNLERLHNTRYSINVITNCSNVNGLLLDDHIPMNDWDKLETIDNTMCSIRGNVPKGSHSVMHIDDSVKFSVIVYAFFWTGNGGSSYAYPAGLANSNHSSLTTDTPKRTTVTPAITTKTTENTSEPATENMSTLPKQNPATSIYDLVRVIEVKATEIEITWSGFQPTQKEMQQYRVQLFYLEGPILDVTKAKISIRDHSEHSIRLTDLKPNTLYTIHLEAVGSGIQMSVGEIQVTTLSESKYRVTVIGTAVGGICLLLMLVIVIIVFRRRRNQSPPEQQVSKDGDNYEIPMQVSEKPSTYEPLQATSENIPNQGLHHQSANTDY